MAGDKQAGPGNSQERLAVAVIVFGFFVFLIGLFPGLIRLDLTPGIGLLQITVFLFGLSLMTLGGYLYVRARRPVPGPSRLPETIGVRLMGTGLVICFVTGYADILGIGSEQVGEPLVLGPVQAAGIVLGAHHLNGHDAPRHARTRHGATDMARAARQQEALLAVRQKVLNLRTGMFQWRFAV